MSHSVRSASRKSSKEFKRSTTDVTIGSRSEIFPTKRSTTVAAIQREESNDLHFIFEIREELLNNVLDGCLKRDQEQNCIKFVARCGYEAMKRIIELEFNMHDFGDEDFGSSLAWTPDAKPMCSPPDTWAASNVPVVTTLGEEELTDNLEEKSSTPVRGSEAMELSSKTTEQSVDLTPQQSVTSLVEQYLLAPHTSEVEMEEYYEQPEEFYVRKEKSVFTTLMTCSTETNPFTQYSSTFKWKTQTQKTMKGTKMSLERRLPRMPESKISITSLPPLRADAQLKIMGSFVKPEPKDGKKEQRK